MAGLTWLLEKDRLITCLAIRDDPSSLDSETTHQVARLQLTLRGHYHLILERPHHRSSSCPPVPQDCNNGAGNPGPNPMVLYGALVGGPDQWDNYVDDRNDYVANEVATDYNAGFQSALVAYISDYM